MSKICSSLLFFAVLVASASPYSLPAEERTTTLPAPRSIAVRLAKIRKSPQYWAPAVAELSFGQTVEVIGDSTETPGWVQVTATQGTGYLPLGALSDKRIVFADAGPKGAPPARFEDDSTIVLAGKGFNQGLEEGYLQTEGISAESLQRLETLDVREPELLAFIEVGELRK